jgi:hypothetical protein
MLQSYLTFFTHSFFYGEKKDVLSMPKSFFMNLKPKYVSKEKQDGMEFSLISASTKTKI